MTRAPAAGSAQQARLHQGVEGAATGTSLSSRVTRGDLISLERDAARKVTRDRLRHVDATHSTAVVPSECDVPTVVLCGPRPKRVCGNQEAAGVRSTAAVRIRWSTKPRHRCRCFWFSLTYPTRVDVLADDSASPPFSLWCVLPSLAAHCRSERSPSGPPQGRKPTACSSAFSVATRPARPPFALSFIGSMRRHLIRRPTLFCNAYAAVWQVPGSFSVPMRNMQTRVVVGISRCKRAWVILTT